MIALLLNAIPAPVWASLAGMVAFAVSLMAARRSGTQAAKTKAAKKAAGEYRATSEAMNNADTGNSDGYGDADWLRKRGKR